MSKNSKLTPKLRFPEFRKGPGWDTELMEQLYSFMRNNALSRDKLTTKDGSVKNVHYGDIHSKFPGLFEITKEPERSVYQPDGSRFRRLIPRLLVEGDLVFADASEDTNDVGKQYRNREARTVSGFLSGQHTILARRNDERLIVGFGGYLFRSGRIRSQIQKESQGTKVYAISSTRSRASKSHFRR